MTWRIEDPAKSMERCYERLHEHEALLVHYEAQGWTHLAKLTRRRIAGTKAAITRLTKMMG